MGLFIGRIPTLEAGPNTAPGAQAKHGPFQLPLMEGHPEPQLPSLSHGGAFRHTLKPALTQRPSSTLNPKSNICLDLSPGPPCLLAFSHPLPYPSLSGQDHFPLTSKTPLPIP